MGQVRPCSMSGPCAKQHPVSPGVYQGLLSAFTLLSSNPFPADPGQKGCKLSGIALAVPRQCIDAGTKFGKFWVMEEADR